MKTKRPPVVVYRMVSVLVALVMRAPLGTNLGLLRVLWAHPLKGVSIASGQLLETRGALIPAHPLEGVSLAASGLSSAEVGQAWHASRMAPQRATYGRWQINKLIDGLWDWGQHEQAWESRRQYGLRICAIDMMGTYRPRLQNCQSAHYNSVAGGGPAPRTGRKASRGHKSLPAIEQGGPSRGHGLIAEVVNTAGGRKAVLRQIVRMPAGSVRHKDLRRALVETARQAQSDDVVSTADGPSKGHFAEFSAAEMLAINTKPFVVRGDAMAPQRATYATFRRAEPPARKGARGRKPTRPQVVRP